MDNRIRNETWERAINGRFDAVVVGGGINGACLYHDLCRAGFRTLLLDKGDFACGTSQASAMMVWGGLLYLTFLDFKTVIQFSNSRDQMIRELGDWVQPLSLRYLPDRRKGRSQAFNLSALYFYWLLGRCRRRRPLLEPQYPEQAFIDSDRFKSSLLYEEASVAPSDARFVCRWVVPHQSPDHVPLNYGSLVGGGFEKSSSLWRLEVEDRLSGRQAEVQSRFVFNTAGVWTDAVNQSFGIETPYRHVYSKGVFIGFPRLESHQVPLVFENPDDPELDSMTFIPWGPVSLWGPTETIAQDHEAAYQVEARDVQMLVDEINRHLRSPRTASEIVSLRCGVRALAIDRQAAPADTTLGLSRRTHVCKADEVPWITVFGGKLTGCVTLAASVTHKLREYIQPSGQPSRGVDAVFQAPQESFPGLDQSFPSAAWCAEKELCFRLEDYLRRRTNIAQWSPRGGLGASNENLEHLQKLAATFRNGQPAEAELRDYSELVRNNFDDVLADF